jgi:rhodanese-related sulfurtransferase
MIVMKIIKKEELKKRLEINDVILIDVLEPEKYNKSHIKGAINIPLEKIVTEAKNRFKKDDKLVVYCSDYTCSSSPAAAKKLVEAGFTNVFDYKEGKKEWEEAEYPME